MYRLFFTVVLASTTVYHVSSEIIKCYECTIPGKTNQEKNLKCPAVTTQSVTCADKLVCGQNEKKTPGSIVLGCVEEGDYSSCVTGGYCCKTDLCNRVAVAATTTTTAPAATTAATTSGGTDSSTKTGTSGQSPISYSLSVLLTAVMAIKCFL